MLLVFSLLFFHQSVNAVAFEGLSPIKIAEDDRTPSAPALIHALTSPLGSERRDAAIAWGRIFKPESLSPLLVLIQDPDPAVQDAALFSLGQLGATETAIAAREHEVTDDLLHLIPDFSVHAKSLALEALAKIQHEDPSNVLIPYFQNESSELRAAATRAVFEFAIAFRNRSADHQYPKFSSELISKLIEGTRDSNVEVRRNAALVLSKAKAPESLEALVRGIRDPDLWVQYYSVQGVGALGNASAASEVAFLLQSTQLSLRLEAVLALQKLKASSLIPASLAQDPSAHVRAAVVTALAANPAIADAQIDAFFKDESPMVRAARINALGARLKGEAKLELIKQGLNDASEFVRVSAVDQLSASEGLEVKLNALLSDPGVTVRAEAIAGFADLTTSSAHATLIDFSVHSPDLAVRSNAYSAFASKPQADFVSVTLDSYRTAKAPKWNDYRFDLVTALSNDQSEESTAALKEMMNDANSKIAYGAWLELSKRKTPNLPAMSEPLPPRSPFANATFAKNPLLVLLTNKGEIRIELYADQAPIHVAQVAGFAEQGGYNGLPWHRIVSDFVIQGGDPDRSGYGGSENPLRAEINPVRFERGTLGMPRNADFDTGGLQLFITHVPTPNLDGLYTVFSQVRAGLEVVDLIEPGDFIISARVIR